MQGDLEVTQALWWQMHLPSQLQPCLQPWQLLPPHSLMLTECHPRCLKGSRCHKRQQKLFSSSGSLMGVLQKFRAGSDVAVAEFVQLPTKFPHGSPRNTSQALSGAVASETEGRVKHLFIGIRFPEGEFKISKLVLSPSLSLQVGTFR